MIMKHCFTFLVLFLASALLASAAWVREEENISNGFAITDGNFRLRVSVLDASAGTYRLGYNNSSARAYLAGFGELDLSTVQEDLGLNITTIRQSAFSSAGTNLTSIIMPDCITTIESSAFQGCSLTNVVLSQNLKTIGSSAFRYCGRLHSVTPLLPRSVTTIGTFAFQNSPISGELELLNTEMTSIGQQAFQYAQISKITFPRQAITINSTCFGLTSGAEIYFPDQAPLAIGSKTFRTPSPSSRAYVYVSRRLDGTDWEAYTTELTDSDLNSANYPGPMTLGILNNYARHWLVNYKSPYEAGPAVIHIH